MLSFGKLNRAYTETWLSGRKYLTANEAGFKSPRGFESLRLRQFKNERLRAPFLFGGDERANCLARVRDSKDFSLSSEARSKSTWRRGRRISLAWFEYLSSHE